jgi:ABC-2 type transport system permease protein
MSPRRIGILLGREVVRGSKNFIFIFAIVVPIVISLIVSLVFGSLFSEKPKLGIADEGSSQIVRLANEVDSLTVREYVSVDDLRKAVETGAVDVGMVLPPGFDKLVTQGEKADLLAYIWGESLLKNRAILGTTIAFLIREVAGQESPVEIVTETLGDVQTIPWQDRLLPFVVLLAIIIGGSMVPASSLVDEKMKRTLTALTITPASLGEVFLAKGLMGAMISLLMGILILVINQAFGAQPLLLILVLALGASMAAIFGVLLGAFVKDINTLFATIKGIGIILYAPALIYLIPEIPQWIAKIFPTYYMIGPIVTITQDGGTWPDIATDVFILIGLIAVMLGITAFVVRRARRVEAVA